METAISQIQNNIGLFKGIIAILTVIAAIGVAWGSIKTTVNHIKNILDKKIEPELNDLSKKVAVLLRDI